jgi:hypothetical protein
VNTCPRFAEIMDKLKISHRILINPPTLLPYTSGIGTHIEALPRHVQRLVGEIPTLMTPKGWDPTTKVDVIIATDGSMANVVGYHSWVISTEEEDTLIQGGGPDGGDLFLMTLYRSERGRVGGCGPCNYRDYQ